ncbi:MAG: alpha/beta fold hydrolase [Thermoactinomyces vulgaris]|jgi:non-heme chloroperoxidase|uniref:alpha/beta fold hydrolase n=1 Tax=Thermoactinomyces sp. Gus2-1 TaxID=1535750 RepID=UPI0005057C97|nr:alpha/beta hydrolase [Thermoactinomyces sp. Gus2-1]KFZ41528.1 alpha/beta hydrolase [Thermoactinomyces sp. Gus2-1]
MGYYVKANHINIYVEDLRPECQKVILFLHGWPGNHHLFEYQFNRLPKYGYRCIGMDIRGFGKSDKPFSGYDYDTLADDVRGVVEALGLRDFTLVGHSTGGAIAARYMGRYQGYGVSKLVLVAAAAPSLIRRTNFPYGVEKETILQIIKDTYRDRPRMLRDFGDRFFYQHTSQAFSDWFFQLGLEAAGWATAAIAKTWIREVLFTDLEAIRVPVLIIHGIHDQVVPFELGEIQQRMIRNARLVPFQFSGHGSFYDEKEEFNHQLARFIGD